MTFSTLFIFVILYSYKRRRKNMRVFRKFCILHLNFFQPEKKLGTICNFNQKYMSRRNQKKICFSVNEMKRNSYKIHKLFKLIFLLSKKIYPIYTLKIFLHLREKLFQILLHDILHESSKLLFSFIHHFKNVNLKASDDCSTTKNYIIFTFQYHSHIAFLYP